MVLVFVAPEARHLGGEPVEPDYWRSKSSRRALISEIKREPPPSFNETWLRQSRAEWASLVALKVSHRSCPGGATVSATSSRPGVGLVVDGAQPLLADVGIDLRGGDIGVTEQFLHDT